MKRIHKWSDNGQMNLVLRTAVKMPTGRRLISPVIAILANDGTWLRSRNHGYGTLEEAEAFKRHSPDVRWWLEGRNYGELPEKEA